LQLHLIFQASNFSSTTGNIEEDFRKMENQKRKKKKEKSGLLSVFYNNAVGMVAEECPQQLCIVGHGSGNICPLLVIIDKPWKRLSKTEAVRSAHRVSGAVAQWRSGVMTCPRTSAVADSFRICREQRISEFVYSTSERKTI
jgi:hypothetical protein